MAVVTFPWIQRRRSPISCRKKYYDENELQQIYIIEIGHFVQLFVCLSVHVYPSSAHSFASIGMKLGMDTPWDPRADMR